MNGAIILIIHMLAPPMATTGQPGSPTASSSAQVRGTAGDGDTAGTGVDGTDAAGTDAAGIMIAGDTAAMDIAGDTDTAVETDIAAVMEIEVVDTGAPTAAIPSGADIEAALLLAPSVAATDIPVDAWPAVVDSAVAPVVADSMVEAAVASTVVAAAVAVAVTAKT